MWKRKGGKDERTRIGPHAQITKFSKTICLWLNKTGVEAKRWRLAPRETAQRTRLTTYQSMRRNWCAPGARSHLSACLFFRKTRGHLFPLDRANSAPEINGQLGFFLNIYIWSVACSGLFPRDCRIDPALHFSLYTHHLILIAYSIQSTWSSRFSSEFCKKIR